VCNSDIFITSSSSSPSMSMFFADVLWGVNGLVDVLHFRALVG
jgi:hypothetical protein